MNHTVDHYTNDQPLPPGMAHNNKFHHGVKVSPAPLLPVVQHIEATFNALNTFSVTDCPYENTYTVFWVPHRASDRLLELIGQELKLKGC